MQFFAAYHFFVILQVYKIRVSPRIAKVVSRMVWHFRAGRKSFSEWFGIFVLGESHFLSGLTRARIVYL